MDKLLYRPNEAAKVLGMGRTRFFDLIRTGKLRSIKRDGYRFITADALHDYVRQLETEAQEVA
jgi:excisionase family DNA binding protein